MVLLLFSLLHFTTAQDANALYLRLNLAPNGGVCMAESERGYSANL